MGRVRGNPGALLVLFFDLAVFLTGSLYAVGDRAWAGNGLFDTGTVAALVVSLVVVFLILIRILWIVANRVDGPARDAPDRP